MSRPSFVAVYAGYVVHLHSHVRTACGGIATPSFQGREAIVKFLRQKWEKAVQQNCSTPAILSCCLQEQEYRLIKELFAFEGNRIGVCFQYEFKDASTGSDATCADHI